MATIDHSQNKEAGDDVRSKVNKSIDEANKVGGKISKILTLAGVLRNNGNGWELINDGGHTPINISSVVLEGNNIRINHTSGASVVGSLLCVADETFAVGGYSFGASVGANHSIISLARHIEASGYINYDGANWQVVAGKEIDSLAWQSTEKVIRITTSIPLAEFISSTLACAVSGRGGELLPFVYQVGTDFIDVGFANYAGTIQTVESNDMKFFFSWNHQGQLKAANVESVAGNIWIYGIMDS
jgi:hypothetical protein